MMLLDILCSVMFLLVMCPSWKAFRCCMRSSYKPEVLRYDTPGIGLCDFSFLRIGGSAVTLQALNWLMSTLCRESSEWSRSRRGRRTSMPSRLW